MRICELVPYSFNQTVASRSIERKHVLQGRRKFLAEGFSQHSARSVKPRPHRFLAYAQQVRGLLDGYLLHIAQHEYEAECRRQLVDGSLKDLTNLAPGSLAFRIGGR
jgi:hypothetical protein